MQNKKFKCSQQELYAVCKMGWDTCFQNLEKFAALKPRYTAEFITARKKEVSDTSLMPDFFKRSAEQEMMRHELLKQMKKALNTWRKLKRFIQDVWQGSESKTMLKNAGHSYFEMARELKWEAGISMLDSGLGFIREQRAKLEAGDIMPPAFPAEMEAMRLLYQNAYDAYSASMQNAELATEAKLKANNKLHADLMSMFSDAKPIFFEEEAMLKQFTFEQVLAKVSGPGTAGIKGSVSNGHPATEPISGLQISLLENKTPADIEEDNTYRFFRLPSAEYTLEVSAPGYLSQTIPGVKVNPGVYTTLHIQLVEEKTK